MHQLWERCATSGWKGRAQGQRQVQGASKELLNWNSTQWMWWSTSASTNTSTGAGASTTTRCKYKYLVQVQLPGASTSQKQINRNATWWWSNVAILWSGCSWGRCTSVVAVLGRSVNSFAGFFPTCLPCTYRCPRVLEWGWCWPYWCKKYLDSTNCTNICSMNIGLICSAVKLYNPLTFEWSCSRSVLLQVFKFP